LTEKFAGGASTAHRLIVVASSEVDERFMRLALVEARKGLGRTSPNPAVGAVLVAGGKIIARAHHRRVGAPHAEAECLGRIHRPAPSGATLYVTLEPCSTVGQTGRCTDAVMRAGLRRVVVGTLDVNPAHRGRGIKILQQAGLDVDVGVLDRECSVLNEAFNKWITTGRPFVIAKCGMTLDGRLTRPGDKSQWITSSAARRDAQILRSHVDAILVGAETVRKDDPRLTVRGVRGAKQPWRVVVTRSGKLPSGCRLLNDDFADKTLVYRGKSLHSVLKDLGRRKVLSVLIEGGGQVLGQALDAALIDKVCVYIGSLLSGGPVMAFAGRGAPDTQNAARLDHVCYRKIAGDVCVTGYPKYREPAHE
jgi:diaminohydroxyphosphoribosylaminopyrimidine deaminase/5-amino-6-(5-phosphoribosylamino)uracil reductase